MKNYSILPQEEKDALVAKARDKGFQTETDYGNCIQSCLIGLREAFPDIGITEDMIRGSFGLAGGCGCSLLGTCGALSGAAFAISLFEGRPLDDLGGDYQKTHDKIQTVVRRFREEYDGITCSEVMIHNMGAVYDWQTPEGDRGYMEHNGTFHCATAVAFATGMVAEMIVNGELK